MRFIAGALTGIVLVLVALALTGPSAKGPRGADDAALNALRDSIRTGDINALRDSIRAGDVAAVSALFAAPANTGPANAQRQRDLFTVFSELHPAVDAFTQAWLSTEPTSAPAMAARANFVYSLGFEWRGGVRASAVHPVRMAAFQQAMGEALALAKRAVAADPGFMPASDLLIYTLGTRRGKDAVLTEVARVMNQVPTRATLVAASEALAPKWGGSLLSIQALCNIHAGRVTDQPGYDAWLCWIEGRMATGQLDRSGQNIAQADLAASDSPLLDRWRDASVPFPTLAALAPKARLKALDAVRATRDLTPVEAELYDLDAGQLGLSVPPQYPAAVARELEATRLAVEREPGSSRALSAYTNALGLDGLFNETDHDDMSDELKRLFVENLMMSRYNNAAWGDLASRVIEEGRQDMLAAIERAEPFVQNAMVFADPGRVESRLQMALYRKHNLYEKWLVEGVSPADPKREKRVAICPLARQYRLVLNNCGFSEQGGAAPAQCEGAYVLAPQRMIEAVETIRASGLCPAEAEASLASLRYDPVVVDLSRF